MTETVDGGRRKLLVVDDEPEILRALKSILARTYSVKLAASGEEAVEFAAEDPPDLVILDLALPGITGMEVCRSLREWTQAPILILSVRSEEVDKIAALDLGADDYLTKPFSSAELLAHVRALLRRTARPQGTADEVRAGDLVVDLKSRQVSRAGQLVKLTPIEYMILATLATNHDRVVTSAMLIRSVWGEADAEDTRILRVHIGNLRSKIEDNRSTPRYVITEPGVGYRFSASSL